MMDNRYKTVMCKHFEQTGDCPLGSKCNFAHGKAELRNTKENIHTGPNPATMTPKQQQIFPGAQGQAQLGPGNYKTMKCKFFEKGQCKFENNCKFAHGDVELRPPSNKGSSVNNMPPQNMANNYDKNLENQIAHQQIQFLASLMEDYHADDQELLGRIKKAAELNQGGNVQDAASILYDIMKRQDQTKQDNDNYAVFVYKIQGFGNSLFQQHISQQNPQPGFQTGGSYAYHENSNNFQDQERSKGYSGQMETSGYGMNDSYSSNGGYNYSGYAGYQSH